MSKAVAPSVDIVWHQYSVDKQKRSQLKQQKPALLWFTGLSGSGKSTLAGALENALVELGYHTYLLDGDNVRHGLCQDLGFSDQDRQENIRRVGEVANLMLDAGLIVLTAFISPHQAQRDQIRAQVNEGEFVEIFMNTPLAECEKRDPKGLYQKARSGIIPHFTGIDSQYQPPIAPELELFSAQYPLDELVAQCLTKLNTLGIIDKR